MPEPKSSTELGSGTAAVGVALTEAEKLAEAATPPFAAVPFKVNVSIPFKPKAPIRVNVVGTAFVLQDVPGPPVVVQRGVISATPVPGLNELEPSPQPVKFSETLANELTSLTVCVA